MVISNNDLGSYINDKEIDYKATIINLHNEFPNFELETLIKIIDNIVLKSNYATNFKWCGNAVKCKL